MANIDNGFCVEILSLDDDTLLATGALAPDTGAGFEAPQGSLYLQQSAGVGGNAFIKFGPADVDWKQLADTVTAETDELIKVSSNDTTASYLANKLLVGGSLTITENNDGGNETLTINTSIPLNAMQIEIDNIETSSGGIFAPDGTYGDNIVDSTLSTVTNSVDLLDALSQMETALSAQGNMPAVGIGLANSSAINSTYTNITWPVTHTQTDATTIEHDPANLDRILIKETGLYLLFASISFDADAGEETIEIRAMIDDTTPIPGSHRRASEDDEINDLSNAFPVELTAGTYVTMQIRASGTGNVLDDTSNFALVKASGARGAAGADGAPGSGTTLTIRDEGTLVPNTPHSSLNFVGGDVTVTDTGTGEATITIGSTFNSTYFSGNNGTTTQTFSAPITINFASNVRLDTNYTVSTVVGGSEVTVASGGWYKIHYTVSIRNTTGSRSNSRTQLELNGTAVSGSESYAYHRNVADGIDTCSSTVLVNVAAADVIRVRSVSLDGVVLSTVSSGCTLIIESIDSP